MGAGVETHTASASTGSIRLPALGEEVGYPELGRDEPEPEECAAERFARRIQWPALVFLASLEAAWLVALAFATHRLVG